MTAHSGICLQPVPTRVTVNRLYGWAAALWHGPAGWDLLADRRAPPVRGCGRKTRRTDGDSLSNRQSPNRPPAQTPRAWWSMPVTNGFALVLLGVLLLAMWVLH